MFSFSRSDLKINYDRMKITLINMRCKINIDFLIVEMFFQTNIYLFHKCISRTMIFQKDISGKEKGGCKDCISLSENDIIDK